MFCAHVLTDFVNRTVTHGHRSTSQMAVTAGTVRVWVAGETV